MSVSEALDTRVDILRKTTVYDGRHPALKMDPPNVGWEDLKNRLEIKIRAHADAVDSRGLEEECWEILEPLISPILHDSSLKSQQFSKGPYACWRYTFAAEYYPNPQVANCIDLHFANAYCPESPFSMSHRSHLLESLLQLLLDAKQANPVARQVVCGSWLNQLSPFLSCFPPAWAQSFTPFTTFYGTAGWWGQYMDHRGAFHLKNASAFRRLGSHPHVAGSCYCDLEEAIHHVSKRLDAL